MIGAARRPAALELLTPAAMGLADRLTIASGIPGTTLMERAGAAVAGRVRDLWDGGDVLVLAGPGNNGGDGFVAARLLAGWGFGVRLALLGDRHALQGDAAIAAAAWHAPVEPLGTPHLGGVGIVVDALFGAGLSRPLPGTAASWAQATGTERRPVVAVDLPSGVNGATGSVVGDAAFAAVETVTFGRAKPGHFLLPGAERCGRLVVADIGLDATAVARAHAEAGPPTWRNAPALWAGSTEPFRPGGHKYRYGHAHVVAGDIAHGGAARLAARAALIGGAGLVTLLAPADALAAHAAHLEAVMVRPLGDRDLAEWLADDRRNAWLLGPGGGVGAALRARAEAVLETGRPTVLDADALTSFVSAPEAIAARAKGPVVLTPHAGEAARLRPASGDKLADARALAAASNAVVVLKGFDSVVAAPDGRATIAVNGCPALASAGTGDVLAGLVLARLARGEPAFEGACAAVWMHNEAAWRDPRGLTAERLLAQLHAAVEPIGKDAA